MLWIKIIRINQNVCNFVSNYIYRYCRISSLSISIDFDLRKFFIFVSLVLKKRNITLYNGAICMSHNSNLAHFFDDSICFRYIIIRFQCWLSKIAFAERFSIFTTTVQANLLFYLWCFQNIKKHSCCLHFILITFYSVFSQCCCNW